jgi:nucleotide-binding universal stress UspA family protein
MYRRILVALDGSPRAERALPHAEALTARLGAMLVLLRVTAPGPDPAGALDAERREADRYLAAWYGRLTAKGLRVHYERPEGPPAPLIAEHSRNQDADLIVLTSQGQGRASGPAVGRVAEALIQSAPCPVLLV